MPKSQPSLRLFHFLLTTFWLLHAGFPPFDAFAGTQTATMASAEERERGLELYRKEDYQEAEIALRRAVKVQKSDLITWHHLALTLERLGKIKGARKAHENAAKLGETLLMSQFNKTAKPDAESLVSLIPPGLQYSALSGRKFLELSPKLSRSTSDEWIERVDLLNDFAELSDPAGHGARLGKVLSGREVSTKARILDKPEPQYTEAARAARTSGTVVLGIILARDGKVRGGVPIRSLPNGLTASAIRAARQVRFTPATKDGQAVSMFIVVEYFFNIH
jgi:TonB family protein